MIDQDVRDLLERMAAEEPVPFLDAEPLTRRARRRAARTVVAGTLGVAVAAAALFAGVAAIRSAPIPAEPPTPTPPEPILRTDGEILWFDDASRDLLAVTPATGDARVLVEAVAFDQGMWSADGRWVAYEAEGSLWVVDAELEPRKVMDLGPEDSLAHRSWVWSSTGALLAVDRGSVLHVVDPASGRTTELASTAGITTLPQWSPDDGTIAFGGADGTIFLVDVRTGERSFLVQLPDVQDLDSVAAITWSPDGSRLAVLSLLEPEHRPDSDIGRAFVLNADGSNVRFLADGDFVPWLAWSPDGSRIVLTERERRGHSRIWIAAADGSTASVVEAPAMFDTPWGVPAWSPDGSRIAFSVEPNRAFVIDADGSGDVERIGDLTYASWSGGSFCWDCLRWIDHPVRYESPDEA